MKNTLSLITTHRTNNGAVHTQVKLNNKDVGLLYLTQEEITVLMDILRHGLLGSDTKLEANIVEDIYEEDEYLSWEENS